MFTYNLSTWTNQLCEHLGVWFHLTTLCKILETHPSASHAKQLQEALQQNIVCIVSKDFVQHFNKNAELNHTRLFSEKTALVNWIMHSAICWSVYTPKVVSLPHFQKAQMSHVLSIVKWNGAYHTKNVIIVLKNFWSKCRQFSACASWFTKDQEGRKLRY